MNRLRRISIILLVLIGLTFAGMLAALIFSQYAVFASLGSALFAEIILGFVVRSANRKMREKAEKEAQADAGTDEGAEEKKEES